VQHATLPSAGTTRRTGDGGYLFGREFPFPHVDKMHLHAVANLCHFGHCLAFVAGTAITDKSGTWSQRLNDLVLHALVAGLFVFPHPGQFAPKVGVGVVRYV
jgi:hypothetical protein